MALGRFFHKKECRRLELIFRQPMSVMDQSVEPFHHHTCTISLLNHFNFISLRMLYNDLTDWNIPHGQ